MESVILTIALMLVFAGFTRKRNPGQQGFAAFGKTFEGMKVVKRIHEVQTEFQYLEKPVRILEITRAIK